MKFKITINDIKKAIKILSPIVNFDHAQLPYRYLLLAVHKDKVELKGYNDHIMGSAFINFYDLENSDNKSIYISAKQFIGLINSFNAGEIVFTIESNLLKIKCGRSNYKLPALDEEVAKESLDPLNFDYNGQISEPFQEENIKVEQFNTAYNSINHCLSKDNSQRNLQSLYICDNAMLACDSVRGASVVFNTKLNDVMLHKDACQCITNLGRSKTINLKIADNKVLGTSDNFVFITTIDSDYPYSEIKPILDKFSEDKDLVVKFDPDNLIDKLNRVLMFADTDTNSVSASINKKDFVLSVENKASAREVINAFENISGKEMSLLVDGKNLRESLSKSLAETRWITDGENEVQYIYDGSLLQFFKGLES